MGAGAGHLPSEMIYAITSEIRPRTRKLRDRVFI